MSTDIAQKKGDLVGTADDAGIHQKGSASTYSPEERDALRALGGLDEASDGDLNMLSMVAKRTGLDPFLKEIYLVGRKTKVGGYRGEPERWITKWTVQTGIDGFRAVLFRAARQLGVSHEITSAVYYTKDGQERPFWMKEWGHPAAAKVRVRMGESWGEGIATWDEFAQTKGNGGLTSMWEKMGPTMLAKCAEAQAHRRVNNLTAGLYIDEEMMQADNRPQASTVRVDLPRGADDGMDAVREVLARKQQSQELPASAPEPAAVDDVLASFVEQVNKAGNYEEVSAIMNSDKVQALEQEAFNELAAVANAKVATFE